MTRALVSLIAIVVVAGCSSAPPSDTRASVERPKLELRLSGPEGPLKVGQPVPIRFEVANVGNVSAEVVNDSGDRYERGLHLTTPEGVDREFVRVNPRGIKAVSERLSPGESKVVDSGLDLSKFLDLTKPGKYKLQARRVHACPDADPIDSNEISITIE